MNGSRNKTAPAVSKNTESGSTATPRERSKSGGGMLKKLKSRRSQTDKCPVVTEDELRALGKDISPDHVLGLRAVTEGTSLSFTEAVKNHTARSMIGHLDYFFFLLVLSSSQLNQLNLAMRGLKQTTDQRCKSSQTASIVSISACASYFFKAQRYNSWV